MVNIHLRHPPALLNSQAKVRSFSRSFSISVMVLSVVSVCFQYEGLEWLSFQRRVAPCYVIMPVKGEIRAPGCGAALSCPGAVRRLTARAH